MEAGTSLTLFLKGILNPSDGLSVSQHHDLSALISQRMVPNLSLRKTAPLYVEKKEHSLRLKASADRHFSGYFRITAKGYKIMQVYVVCELRKKKPHQIDSYYFPSKFLLADIWKIVPTKDEAEKMLKDWADYQEEEMGGIERYDEDQKKYVPIWCGEPIHKRLKERDDRGREFEIETFENYPEYLCGYTAMEITDAFGSKID